MIGLYKVLYDLITPYLTLSIPCPTQYSNLGVPENSGAPRFFFRTDEAFDRYDFLKCACMLNDKFSLLLYSEKIKKMKKYRVSGSLILGIALLLSGPVAQGQNPSDKPGRVRVMTYNVRHCAGMDLKLDYDRTAGVILKQQPDVVAIQELDSMTTRGNQRYQLDELARRANYFPTYAAAIKYDGGKYGVGILTRERPLSVKRIPLPGKEPRVLLVVELKDYVMACTHLDLNEKERLESVPIIVAEAQRWQKPFVIAGDWNDHPNSKLLKELKKCFKINTGKRSTYPADNPNECIDYIATTKTMPAKAKHYEVVVEPETSDHRPVVADLKMRFKAKDR